MNPDKITTYGFGNEQITMVEKLRVLVVYYSQSGQLGQILDQVLKDVANRITVDFAKIEPVQPFPFPWNASSFFDAMPETVLRIPTELQAMPAMMEKDYDLVIFGYQPWFLSPSIPANSFLKSEWASVLRGKKVVTVIGSRNMWLHAQECVKEALQGLGARHVGNIVLEDKHANMVSTLTIIRWLFKGQKEASRFLPAAGVSDQDIADTRKYGPLIVDSIQNGREEQLQDSLLRLGAVQLRPGLIVLERRGLSQFPKWAARARSKGNPGNPERLKVIRAFQRLLMVAIFALSPLSSLTAGIQTLLSRKRLMKQVDYFKGVQYKSGVL
jgi:hypothetical protein